MTTNNPYIMIKSNSDIRKTALERSDSWWFCENIVNHPGQVALLRMGFPQVFILIRDYGESYFASFEEFRENIAEVNFFNPSDRETADLEDILTDAWNFLSLEEEEEERQAEMLEEEDGI